MNEQIQDTNTTTNTNTEQKSLQAVGRMNGDDVFVVIFCVACDVIGGTDCLIYSSLSLSLSLSIVLALSPQFDFDSYLCALYMQPYVDQMWRSRWPLGCRPKRLKTIAAHCQIACSVGGNLACNSATLIRFWVSDSLPPFRIPSRDVRQPHLSGA